MSACKINHSLEEVTQKAADQVSFLPKVLYEEICRFLVKHPNQVTLNEIFHLLKKYDLAPEEEKAERNESLQQLINE